MKKKALILGVCVGIAVFFAGCGVAEDRAYFNGVLTVAGDSARFTDRANNVTMRVDEASIGKLKRADAAVSYWAEFYGRTEDHSSENRLEIDVHIDKLIIMERRDTVPATPLVVGKYECLIDGTKQQLFVLSDYTCAWVIYPETKYEIITWGAWQRTADKELLFTPFEEQTDRPVAEMSYYATVTVSEDGEIVIEKGQPKENAEPAVSEDVSDSLLTERTRQIRESNRKIIAEEDARRRATPRPGVTRFEIDPRSETLIEKEQKEQGTIVFWKTYM